MNQRLWVKGDKKGQVDLELTFKILFRGKEPGPQVKKFIKIRLFLNLVWVIL